MVTATTILPAEEGERIGPITMDWPADIIHGSLTEVFAVSTKVTIEKDDGSVITYVPHWLEDAD